LVFWLFGIKWFTIRRFQSIGRRVFADSTTHQSYCENRGVRILTALKRRPVGEGSGPDLSTSAPSRHQYHDSTQCGLGRPTLHSSTLYSKQPEKATMLHKQRHLSSVLTLLVIAGLSLTLVDCSSCPRPDVWQPPPPPPNPGDGPRGDPGEGPRWGPWGGPPW
jgi:hypothetical protein